MLDFPRWKIWTICLTLIIGVLLAIPSLMPESIIKKHGATTSDHEYMFRTTAGDYFCNIFYKIGFYKNFFYCILEFFQLLSRDYGLHNIGFVFNF